VNIPQKTTPIVFTIKGYYAGLRLGFGSRKKSSKNAEKLKKEQIANRFYGVFTLELHFFYDKLRHQYPAYWLESEKKADVGTRR
jgi:hypothetical protein